LIDSRYEYLAVADFAGAGGLDDGVHGALEKCIRNDDFDFHLG
jgi:hypothetical protein